MRKIRTTMEPGREIEVTEQEYTDLSRQGLVADEDTVPDTELTPDSLAEAGRRATKPKGN